LPPALAVLPARVYFFGCTRRLYSEGAARSAMGIDALGYIGVRAKEVEDWASYGEKLLGLQRIDKSRSSLAFRMDDRKQRLVVDADGGQGIGFFGWEVADAAALDAIAARVEAAGTKVACGSRTLAGERRVADLIVFNDPAGNRLEIFHGAETAADPFRPGRNISGFRTGPLGMGHVVMHFERIAEVMAFYQNVLEFKLSDYWLRPFPAYFLHVNPRHHSIAFVESGINMIHHMMVTHRRYARTPFRRLRHIVLHLESVWLFSRVRLGRPTHRRQQLEAVRAQIWSKPLGS
jgi:2,3-dihydroxybiphenyl 1,2-dioxygenase